MSIRHFRSLLDLNAQELRQIICRASELKNMLAEGVAHEFLKNKSLAMIFEKSSTRTRVSFETGMAQLGGSSIFLSPADSQIGRGEPIEDTARVLSRMVDAIMVRTFSHETVEIWQSIHQCRLSMASLTPTTLANCWQTYRLILKIVATFKVKQSAG